MGEENYSIVLKILMGMIGLSLIVLNNQWANLNYRWAKFFSYNKGVADNIFAYKIMNYIFGVFFIIVSVISIVFTE